MMRKEARQKRVHHRDTEAQRKAEGFEPQIKADTKRMTQIKQKQRRWIPDRSLRE